MADKPINLNKARKARARTKARARADENAVRFGRTKAERTREEAEKSAEIQRLDAHLRDDTL